MARISWWCGIIADAVALVVTCIVFLFMILVYHRPDGRSTLRRQSLYMLVAVQLATLLFSSSHIVSLVLRHSPRMCEFSVLVTLFTSNFQHFAIMLIAVNLQMTVVHHISTIGFTKWYIISSLMAAFVTCIPGGVAHVWGFDPFVDVCWSVLTDRDERVFWTISSTYVWTILSAAITMVSTLSVIFVLFLSSLRVHAALKGPNLSSSCISNQHILRSVILRILPHPVFLVISNVIVVSADLSVSLYRHPPLPQDITNNDCDTAADILFILFYTTPPLFFALTFLFFDPSLSAAIRKLFHQEPTILGCTYPNMKVSYSLPIPLYSSSQISTKASLSHFPDSQDGHIPAHSTANMDSSVWRNNGLLSDIHTHPQVSWIVQPQRSHKCSTLNLDQL